MLPLRATHRVVVAPRAQDYVADEVRRLNPLVEDAKIRNVMGSLGLIGDKALRLIGSLSGGEKARVALAVFCLTPCNVVLFDEPSNHLDSQSISALITALDEYEGAIVVVSHDRAFCEAIRCTHVAYVAEGQVTLEERELRPSDFSTADRGVANVDVDESGERGAPVDKEAEKAFRADERRVQKERSAAPKKLKVVEEKIAKAEAKLEALAAEMVAAGSDASKALELSAEQDKVQSQVDELFEEWERLEAVMAE